MVKGFCLYHWPFCWLFLFLLCIHPNSALNFIKFLTTVCVFSRLVLIVSDFHALKQALTSLYFPLQNIRLTVLPVDVLKGNTPSFILRKWQNKNGTQKTWKFVKQKSKTSSTFVYLFTLVADWSSLSNRRNCILCVGPRNSRAYAYIYTKRQVYFFYISRMFSILFRPHSSSVYFNHRYSLAAFQKTFFFRGKFTTNNKRKMEKFCFFRLYLRDECAYINITSSNIFSHFVLFFLILRKNY